MRYEVEVPIPPSTNHLYPTVNGRRVKSKKYREWLSLALWPIKAGLPVLTPPISVRVVIRAGKGFRKNSDISNRIKAVEDALVKAGRVEDDNVNFVTETSAVYLGPGSVGSIATCTVVIEDSLLDERERER